MVVNKARLLVTRILVPFSTISLISIVSLAGFFIGISTSIAASPLPAAPSVTLTVEHCDGHQLLVTADQPVYLSQLLALSDWRKCNYPFGAHLSFAAREPAQLALQQRLLAFLHHVVGAESNQQQATDAQVYFQQVLNLVSQQAVTGRRPVSLIDPKAIELAINQDPIVRTGAVLRLVNRPDSIQLVGFHRISLRHAPAQTITDYVRAAGLLPGLVPGQVWVIQANGQVDQLRYGAWTYNAVAVSPGAWVMALAPKRWIRDYPAFNEDLASWLVTQSF